LNTSLRHSASTTEARHFNVDHLATGLKQRSARGAALTLVSQAIKFIALIGGSAVLGRILTPQDYGLIGMVSAVTGILLIFGNLGLSSAIIQQPEINQRQMSTLFWLNSALGLGLTLLTAAIAPVLAWFYHDYRLAPVAAAFGLGFFIGGLGVQHGALLKRQMRFGILSAVEIATSIVTTATGILLAWFGFGYWSLVIMQLAGVLTASVAAWIACRWRPGWPSRHSGIRAMVAFGSNLTLFGAVNYFARNFDNVLIGWQWGPADLGQYSKAYNLLLFPLAQISTPISNVAVPALSRLQADPVRYRNYYLKGLNLIAYITVPLVIGLAVYSEEIVFVVLGPQWSQAAKIFRILAISAVLQPIGNTTGWLYTSLNRTSTMARWGIISAPCFVASFAIGLPWGAVGVATSYSVVSWPLTYACLVMAIKGTPVSMKDIGDALYRPATIGIVLGASMLACRVFLVRFGMTWMFFISALVCAILLFTIRQCWGSVRADMDGIFATVRMIKSGSGRPESTARMSATNLNV
jgi:O-antigen/teichoic acid export membrane protein